MEVLVNKNILVDLNNIASELEDGGFRTEAAIVNNVFLKVAGSKKLAEWRDSPVPRGEFAPIDPPEFKWAPGQEDDMDTVSRAVSNFTKAYDALENRVIMQYPDLDSGEAMKATGELAKLLQTADSELRGVDERDQIIQALQDYDGGGGEHLLSWATDLVSDRAPYERSEDDYPERD